MVLLATLLIQVATGTQTPLRGPWEAACRSCHRLGAHRGLVPVPMPARRSCRFAPSPARPAAGLSLDSSPRIPRPGASGVHLPRVSGL